jgi:hypothetical protein
LPCGRGSACIAGERPLFDSESLRTYGVFQKELYSGIPNYAVWRVLRKQQGQRQAVSVTVAFNPEYAKTSGGVSEIMPAV